MKKSLPLTLLAFLFSAFLFTASDELAAQDRLPAMPGHDNYQKMVKQLPGAVKSGAISVSWKDGGKSFEYQHDGKLFRYDIATGKTEQLPDPKTPGKGPPGKFGPGGGKGGGKGGGGVAGGAARGRQSTSTRLARRPVQGVLPRPQPVALRRQGLDRNGRHDRRQREVPHQERHGELGLRRGTVPADRDVVVAGQQEDRLLPLRRGEGCRLLPGARPDRAHDETRRRAVSRRPARRTRSSICSSTTWPRRRR